MREKPQKGYWLKRTERFPEGSKARERAEILRGVEQVAHVKSGKQGDGYVVSYSVAKWYLEELEKAGLRL